MGDLSFFLALLILSGTLTAKEEQTLRFKPISDHCVDEPAFDLEAESFDFEGDTIRVMTLNIHTGIGGFSASTEGGISTQYLQPEIWPQIIEEIADRIFQQHADIVGLQEVVGGDRFINDGRINRRDSEQCEIIKSELNRLEDAEVWDYQFWTHNTGQSSSRTSGVWWGVATFYRTPWRLTGSPSMHPTSGAGDTKSMLQTTLTNGFRTIDVFSAHFDSDLPEPADGSIQYSERNAAPALAAAGNPTLLIGDLNVEPHHKMPDGSLQLQPVFDAGLVDSAVLAGVVPFHGFGPGPDFLHTKRKPFGGSSKRIDWVLAERGEFTATGVEVYRAQDDPSTTMPSPHPSLAAGVNKFPEAQETSFISDHNAFLADLKTRGNPTALPVAFRSSNPEVAAVSGRTVRLAGTGTTILTALQPGDETFAPALEVSHLLRVNGPLQILLEESFEDDGSETRYTVFGITANSSNSFFHRSRTDGDFTESEGEWYFSGSGLSFQAGNPGFDDSDSTLNKSGKAALLFNPITIAGLTNLGIEIAVAASLLGKFDISRTNGDKLAIQASMDGKPFVEIARFQSAGENGPLLSPDGVPLSTAFTDFSLPLNETGDSLRLRIVLRSTSGAGDEAIAFDKVRVFAERTVKREDVLPLGGACRPLPGAENYFESPWFGVYNTTFQPWIFHQFHKFIYLYPGSTPEDIFFFDPVIGTWAYTSSDRYPNLFLFDGQGWVFFFNEASEKRSFFRYSDGTFVFYD